MKHYKDIIENVVRSYGVPEFVEDFDISCEGFIEGLVDWLTDWDWEYHFGLPEGIYDFVNIHKAKDFTRTITSQCYEIILTTLIEHFFDLDEETVKRNRKGKTDADYIVDVLNEIVEKQVWYGSWLVWVDNSWADEGDDWTKVGNRCYSYLKKAYQTAKRGTVKWQELEEAGLVKSLLGYGVY